MLRSFRGEPESPRGWAPSQERGTGRQGAGGGPGTEGTQGAGAVAQGVGAAVLGVARGGAPTAGQEGPAARSGRVSSGVVGAIADKGTARHGCHCRNWGDPTGVPALPPPLTPDSTPHGQVGAAGRGGAGRSCGDQESPVDRGGSQRCRLAWEQSRVSETPCARQHVPTASRLPPRKLQHPARKNKTPRVIPAFSTSPLKSEKETERTNGQQVPAGRGRGGTAAASAGLRPPAPRKVTVAWLSAVHVRTEVARTSRAVFEAELQNAQIHGEPAGLQIIFQMKNENNNATLSWGGARLAHDFSKTRFSPGGSD